MAVEFQPENLDPQLSNFCYKRLNHYNKSLKLTPMPRQKSPTLTEAELRLMSILWNKGKGTVSDVVNALPADQPKAYKTVLTILRILEQKGYLKHTKRSRAFVYYPVVERDEARLHAVKDMVSRFFDDSPELLVLRILEDEQIASKELSRLKEMIEKRQSEESQ